MPLTPMTLPLEPFAGQVLEPFAPQSPPVFPAIIVLVAVRVALLKTAPPSPPVAELPEKVLPAIVIVTFVLVKIAPPTFAPWAKFPENVLWLMATMPLPTDMAPP